MNKKYFKIIYTIVLLLNVFYLLVGGISQATNIGPGTADELKENLMRTGIKGYGTGTVDERSLPSIIALVIKAFLGLLGVIFVIYIIYAGYTWMTAQGEEEKVTKAKDTLQRAIIGLIIIISAYAITYFVFTNLPGGGPGADVTGG